MHQKLFVILVTLVVSAAVLVILQIWGLLPDWEVFVKILMTIGVIVLVVGFLMVVKSDFGPQKKLKDDNYLD
jgi:uncharacterized membrane protein (DUF441 family)